MSPVQPALLAIDIGNTTIRWRLFDPQGRPGAGGCHPTHEAAAAASGLVAAGRDATGPAPQAAICSVVSRAEEQVRAALEEAGMRAATLGRDLRVPIATRYGDPTQLGADRLANAVAAFAAAGGPCLVAAAGTAITVDVVGADGTHLGGAIAPGVDAAAAGLLDRVAADSLSALDRATLLDPPEHVAQPPTATREALRLGLLVGYAGLIDRLIEVQRHCVGEAAAVIGTGGALPALLPWIRTKLTYEPELTLQGVRLVWTHARDRQ